MPLDFIKVLWLEKNKDGSYGFLFVKLGKKF